MDLIQGCRNPVLGGCNPARCFCPQAFAKGRWEPRWKGWLPGRSQNPAGVQIQHIQDFNYDVQKPLKASGIFVESVRFHFGYSAQCGATKSSSSCFFCSLVFSLNHTYLILEDHINMNNLESKHHTHTRHWLIHFVNIFCSHPIFHSGSFECLPAQGDQYSVIVYYSGLLFLLDFFSISLI